MKRRRKPSDPRAAIVRRTLPEVESLECRALLSVASPAYYPNGAEVIDVVYPNSALYQYDNSGHSTYLGNNVIAASVAVDPFGNQYQDVVFNDGALYQFDSGGAHFLGNNVLSASLAVSPAGGLVQDVVFDNGDLFQYDATGAHYLGDNAVDTSTTFQKVYGSGEIQDVVFNNGSLYEFDAAGAHFLGAGVVSAGVADAVAPNPDFPSQPLESLTQVVIFSTGADYQYDLAGAHYLGQLFTPATSPPPGMPTATIATSQQPASAVVGTSFADQATVTGNAGVPTGSVTFTLLSATGVPLYIDPNEPLAAAGSNQAVATSKGYTPAAAGTDYWVAAYNGGNTYGPVTSGTTAAPVTITPTSPAPTIATSQQPATATVGSPIADRATVTGSAGAPTGTVTFTLLSSTGVVLYTDPNEPLAAAGSNQAVATSKGYAPTAAGTDYWVATYNGGNTYGPVTSGTTAEPVTITPMASLATNYSGTLQDSVGTDHLEGVTTSIFLSNVVVSKGAQGDSVTGTLTITNFAGDQINENFTGVYTPTGSILPSLTVIDQSGSDPGEVYFNFQINPDGSLYVEHQTDSKYLLTVPAHGDGFDITDNGDAISDAFFGQTSDYASLKPS